jgi:hypothetical protein
LVLSNIFATTTNHKARGSQTVAHVPKFENPMYNRNVELKEQILYTKRQ